MLNSLLDIFHTVDIYTSYLENRGFPFSSDGLPIFTKDMFLQQVPDLMVPAQKRHSRSIKDKKSTVVNFFCGDTDVYRRLDKLLAELDDYSEYMGVVGPDVTVTSDMDPEWQYELMLLNQLGMAVLASYGIKIVHNTRCGITSTFDMFKYIPHGVAAASGFVGGPRHGGTPSFTYISKALLLRPKFLLLYGSCSLVTLAQLDSFGIPHYQYLDYHRYSKRR